MAKRRFAGFVRRSSQTDEPRTPEMLVSQREGG
jgi:hypothetical protein